MDGADVIPIGTRGRPGGGTGKQPSTAARDLGRPARGTPRPRVPLPRPEATPLADDAGSTRDRMVTQDPVLDLESVRSATGTVDRDADRAGRRGTPVGVPRAALMAALRHAAVEVFGDDWEQRLAHFLVFLRRRLAGDYAIDDYGLDRELTERFLLAVLRPVAQRWFRIEVRGAENIPVTGGALVVSNHSGTIPLDALMTLLALHDATGRCLRPLGADLVFKLPVLSGMARKARATLACSEDAERMLAGGELVGAWPEGFKGIGKPYSERYKLQRFGRGGFVSAALRTGVPIVPVSVVGAEEIYPLIGNVPSLARLLGVPYIPITPLFPLLGPLGLVPLPSKWIIEFGEPIRTDELGAGAAEDPMLVFNLTDQVRETIQRTLYSLLKQRKSIFH